MLFFYGPHSYWLLFWCCSVGHQIEETLRAAGKSQLFTRLSYPGAGHLIEPPYAPNSRTSLWSVKPQKREPHLRAASYTCCRHILNVSLFIITLNIYYCGNSVFSLLQGSLCGEVTPRPTLLPRKMPGRRFWILWKVI